MMTRNSWRPASMQESVNDYFCGQIFISCDENVWFVTSTNMPYNNTNVIMASIYIDFYVT